MFDPNYWRERKAVAGTAGAGRGTVYFLSLASEQWALRHYRRGGMVGRLFEDHFVYLGQGATRSFREFRLLARLYKLGLPVPRPVAACYRRAGLAYTADLLSVRIPGAQPLSRRLSEGTAPNQLWEKAGSLIRRFHDAGACHADLTAHNLLVDDSGLLYLLDFDRGRIRQDGPWKQQTLERLQRSLRKVSSQDPAINVTASDWQRFMTAYRA